MGDQATPERVAIIGAGLMGHGIAQHFAVRGYAVSIFDAFPDVLESVPSRIASNLRLLGMDESATGNIRLARTIADAVEGAGIVFEAVLEDLPLKQRIFVELAESAPGDCILASNTSVIPITSIAAGVSDAGRVVGTHWWNPPYLIPLVEVVQAERTDISCIERTISFLRTAGKLPVHVKRDVPGFIGNRLQHALLREAISIVEAGICDAATVDLVVKNSFGMRLPVVGPLENTDLVGLDLILAVHRILFPHLDDSHDPSPLLTRLAEANRLGMKSGGGFYDWNEESSTKVRNALLKHLMAQPAGTRAG